MLRCAVVLVILIELFSSMLCNAWLPLRFGKVARSILSKPLYMSTSVKVTTYNVLSSSLSEASYFTACCPEHLDPPTRLEKLRKKLQPEIDSKSIICLQEVSQEWAGNLYGFFFQHNYHLVTGLYGSKFDGYMGVGIAIPMDKYDVNTVDITRVADTKTVIEKIPEARPEGFVAETLDKVRRMWKSFVAIWTGRRPRFNEDLWDMVKKRHNQMICTELLCKDSQKTFVVGTYHMPCAFRNPDMMVVHSALSAQHIQKWANGKPHLFVGDYNFKPDSSSYSLMMNGFLDSNHSDYPVMQANDSWTPALQTPLRSAYNTSQGCEPNFTNYAQIQSQPVFIETLDYIFHSPEWTVDEVKPLPHRSEVVGPLPNEEEPSDHILISARLSLK